MSKKGNLIYFKALGAHPGDTVYSEITPNTPAQDVHHIDASGMGGRKSMDRIENLMALTRKQHDRYGDKKAFKYMLFKVHKDFLDRNKIPHDKEYLNNQINKWKI